MNPEDVVVVLVTVPAEAVGRRIATALVEEHLAACVSMIPGLRSIFFWEGRVQEEPELLLLAKTRAERLAELEARVRAIHPYSVPEVIAVPAAGGHAPYLAWVGECVTRKGGDEYDQE